MEKDIAYERLAGSLERSNALKPKQALQASARRSSRPFARRGGSCCICVGPVGPQLSHRRRKCCFEDDEWPLLLLRCGAHFRSAKWVTLLRLHRREAHLVGLADLSVIRCGCPNWRERPMDEAVRAAMALVADGLNNFLWNRILRSD